MEISLPSTHPEFGAADADLIVQSVDGTQFHLHRKYLEAHTGAFPGPGAVGFNSNTRQDVTHLTEPASVLEILFQFVYPKRHPALEDTSFEILAPLAEAIEKYEVFSAMSICEVQLGFTEKHAPEILAHAIKHNRAKLINDTALYLVRSSTLLSEIAEELPTNAVIPWLRYYEAYRACPMCRALGHPRTTCTTCAVRIPGQRVLPFASFLAGK
ncbi:hypothetical protein BDZ97DRAFT_55529 [Flammula alnicola]|nr:hypothetical protein BDZ97DRAFT_55529 [Flammula alnicola]